MLEQAPGDGEGQGSLACCSPWGHKESDKTEQLNNNRYLWVGQQRKNDRRASATVSDAASEVETIYLKSPKLGEEGSGEGVTYPRGHTSESKGTTTDNPAGTADTPLGIPGGQHVVTILRGHIQITPMVGIKGLTDIT